MSSRRNSAEDHIKVFTQAITQQRDDFYDAGDHGEAEMLQGGAAVGEAQANHWYLFLRKVELRVGRPCPHFTPRPEGSDVLI